VRSGLTGRFIFYTFAEATRIPAAWVEVLNACTEVWAPSDFVRNALAASGVYRPLRVVRLGVECPTEPTLRTDADGTTPFTIMWQGSRLKSFRQGRPIDGDRKRGLLVETAFRRANLPHARLILKYLPTEGVSYDFRTGPIWYICKKLTAHEMRAIDEQVDIFLWPTMGEGFGLPPLEKLAQGIPAYATYWSGPREYLQDFPLQRLEPTRMESVRFNGAMAEMAHVEESTVVDLMRACYANQIALRNSRHQLHQLAKRWDIEQQLQPALEDAILDNKHRSIDS
jgi:hypothetical protein